MVEIVVIVAVAVGLVVPEVVALAGVPVGINVKFESKENCYVIRLNNRSLINCLRKLHLIIVIIRHTGR